MAFFEKLLGDKYKKELTHEELEALIESKYNDLTKERDAFKSSSDKNASEAASWRKQYTEKLTEAEKKELEYQEIIKQNKELVRDSNIAKHTAQFIGLGYDENLAKETAIAQIDGDFDKVFANQKKFNEIQKANFEKENLKNTPKPPAGDPNGKITKEQFNKMGYEERVKLLETDPTTYAELTK